jgi:hypothetical protein
VNALVVNKEQRIPDIAYSSEVGNIHEPDVLVVHGQEFHTSYWGHLGLLHPEGGLLLPGYVGYPNTAAASLVPTNADVADMAHAEGAVVGYVHPFDELPEPIAKPVERLTNELPIDVALGKVDYMEILGFSDHRSTAAIWYRLLNLGFRIPAAAGTDAMADYASLRGPVGLNRVYVQVPKGPLDINRWLEGLRAGRTFATNGPLLSFELEGQGPGSQLNRSGSVTTLQFKARLSSIVPVDRLEVVCDGQVVASLLKGTASKEATIEGPVTRTKSGWCLLRADSNDSAYPVLDTYTYATTSPVYLNLNGTGPRSKDDAAFFLAWIDRVRQTTSQHPDWRNMAEKQRVLGQIDQARREFGKLQ